MEERISTVRKLSMRKEDIHSVVMLDKDLTGADLKFLEDEFDVYKEDIDNFVKGYKNLGIVFKLSAIEEEFMKDWKIFLQIRTDMGKFSNVFSNSAGDKILLVSNKRLLKVDLFKLNEKIEAANFRIEKYNEKVADDMKSDSPSAEKKGLIGKLIDVLKK